MKEVEVEDSSCTNATVPLEVVVVAFTLYPVTGLDGSVLTFVHWTSITLAPLANVRVILGADVIIAFTPPSRGGGI